MAADAKLKSPGTQNTCEHGEGGTMTTPSGKERVDAITTHAPCITAANKHIYWEQLRPQYLANCDAIARDLDALKVAGEELARLREVTHHDAKIALGNLARWAADYSSGTQAAESWKATVSAYLNTAHQKLANVANGENQRAASPSRIALLARCERLQRARARNLVARLMLRVGPMGVDRANRWLRTAKAIEQKYLGGEP